MAPASLIARTGFAVINSPRKSASPVSRRVRRAVRNSRSTAIGRSNGVPNVCSVNVFVPSARPSRNRPPVAACAACTWVATSTGCRPKIGIAEVPTSTSGSSRATTVASVVAS
ncbi:hypothetical protein GCM10009539_65820 [Cryptosporangium japonicum]|uniref:Uncharacterized protein n=1 Tax=Cryptosporangium japonicum TaxID=80872 RepID=A0ABN0V0P2_9ACTN